MALWEVTGTILPKLVMTHRFTPMRSDMGQGGDCCWAIATAVYSRTSDRSGMRRLWYSLILAHAYIMECCNILGEYSCWDVNFAICMHRIGHYLNTTST